MDEEEQVPFKQYFPKFSMSSYFWLVILISMVIFGIIGYFVGIRVSELPSSMLSPTPTSSVTQQGQAPFQNNDSDDDYSDISGSFTTSTDIYDQYVVLVRAAGGIVDSDSRTFDKPHVEIQYPYEFSRMNPLHSYVVSAFACFINPHTYALECAKNIKVTKCSGKIQGATCVIDSKGSVQSLNEVDFFIPKDSAPTSLSSAQK